MKLSAISLAVAALATALQWPAFESWRADAKLQEFYSDMASARFELANDSINEAIRIAPWNCRYYSWRGYCRSQSLQSQCSKKQTDSARNLNGANEGIIESAIDDYQHALRLNPRDAVAFHNLAWLEHLLGNDSAAEKNWRESTRIDPDNAIFHISYGMFLEESGATNLASDQYREAVELSPSIVDSPFFARLRERNDFVAESVVTDSISRLESRLQQGPDPILEARLGKLNLYSKQIGRSELLLQHAASQLPNLPLVWFNLGEVKEANGDLGGAMTDYRRASAIDASLAAADLQMAEIDLRKGQKSSAAQNFKLAIQRWQRVNPITAAHNNRLYAGPRQMIDDLLPTTLVWYVTPCVASRAWNGLSQLFPEDSQYARRSHTCEELPSPHRFTGNN